jgi:hypothetical protein
MALSTPFRKFLKKIFHPARASVNNLFILLFMPENPYFKPLSVISINNINKIPIHSLLYNKKYKNIVLKSFCLNYYLLFI